MAVGLLSGDPALVDQGLDEGVVLGDLGQLTVAQQIAAGVADVHQAQAVTGEQDRAIQAATSDWIALTRDPSTFAKLISSGGDWRPLTGRQGFSAWTDDYATILPVLRGVGGN